MKKLLLFLSVSLSLTSLNAFWVQPMVDEEPDGEPIELTDEQFDACVNTCAFFKTHQQWVDKGWSSEDVVELPFPHEQIFDLLNVLEDNTHNINIFSGERVLKLMKFADYLGLQREDIKTACAQRIVALDPKTVSTMIENHFNLFHNFFNNRYCTQIFEHALQEYVEPTLLRTLEGHTGQVFSVNWSPDGSMLATGSMDKTAKIWNAHTGECLCTLEKFTRLVSWSPNSTLLATDSWDDSVKIWCANTGTCARTLEGHKHWISSVSWSPDSKKLATRSCDNTVKIWYIETAECVHTLSGHNWIRSVSWSPDGNKLATGSEDETVKIWNAHTGRYLHTLTGHTNWVNSVSWSPDGNKLATGSRDRTAKIWDTNTSTCACTLKGHTDSVNSVTWAPDGNKLMTRSSDDTVKIWSANTGACLYTLKKLSWTFWRPVIWSPDGNKLATQSDNNTATIWEFPTLNIGQLLCVLWARSGVDDATLEPQQETTNPSPDSLQPHVLNPHEVLKALFNSLPKNVKTKLSCKSSQCLVKRCIESLKKNTPRNILIKSCVVALFCKFC
jgi:WD40 repeat protein